MCIRDRHGSLLALICYNQGIYSQRIQTGKEYQHILSIDLCNSYRYFFPVSYTHLDVYKRQILAAACKEDRIPGEGSVYFSCSAENESWKNILGHIGAEHAWDEYMLERKLIISEKTETDIYCRIVETAPENKTEANDTITSGNIVWHAIGCRLNQNIPLCFTSPEVICFLAPQGESVYLYSLQVLPELRNRHLGLSLIHISL